jgi:hypothetical protein
VLFEGLDGRIKPRLAAQRARPGFLQHRSRHRPKAAPMQPIKQDLSVADGGRDIRLIRETCGLAKVPIRQFASADQAKTAPIIPIPRDAGRCDIRFEGREADERYWFRDATGAVLFGELQWRTPGREKQVRPCVYTAKGWREAAPPAPRALFNLDKQAARPDAAVFLFEGPRKAAKAAACFPDAVTSAFAGGASASGQIDFSPLRDRQVTLWRDSDEAGERWQEAIVAALQAAGAASIGAIDPTRFPEEMLACIPEQKRAKFDVVDFIEAGLSPKAIGEAVEAACGPVAMGR